MKDTGHELSVVGKRLPRPDAAEKATGTAKYADDLKLPGMLIGKVLRSPLPHAKILRVDTSKAEKFPGVAAVITFADIDKVLFNNSCLGILQNPEKAPEIRTQYILTDKVRFVGDAVAAVAAVNESVAEEALGLIEVEYEPLPAVFDAVAAMDSNAPRIHDASERNIAAHMRFPFSAGDVGKGLQEADAVIEGTFRTARQKFCQIEPSTAIASFDPYGRLTVWSPSQQAHLARTQIARLFNMPEGMVRWITPTTGGSFGARQSFVAEPICAALAKKAGKPVKLSDTRKEDLTVRECRESFILSGKLGVKKDGTITALQVNLVTDAGAYFSHSAAASSVCMRYFLGLYRCPNTLGEADIVYTNTPMTGGMRGYGDPGATFAREQLIDMAAERLGVDPLEFRLKNAKATGEPSTIPTISIESSALDECIRLGAERFGWQGKRGLARQGTIKRGMGMACLTHNSNAFPTLLENSNAVIKLNPDGSVNLLVSACEMGQGILGVLAQIAAEVLGINAGDVHVITGDTDTTPFDVGAHASRSTNVLGNAVLGAAQEVKNQLLLRAAKMLEAAAGELETNNGRIHIKASSEKGVSIAEVARNATYNYQGDSQDVLGKCSFVPQLSAAFQATFAEVEVDAETGQLKVLKIVIAADVGRAINPTSVEGQLEGSVVQGIGYALSEETVINNEGITVTDSFASYKIPTTLDLPEIEVILVEHPIASGPFGAKGLGELGIGAVAPAIVSAVCDAVGVRITELPITPEKILDGLRILTKE